MNQRERMLAGLPYKAWLDGLEEERIACKQKIYEFNHLPPTEQDKILELLKQLLGKQGNTSGSKRRFTVITAGTSKSAKTSLPTIT